MKAITILILVMLLMGSSGLAQKKIEPGKTDRIELEDFTLFFGDKCLKEKTEWTIVEQNAMVSELKIMGYFKDNLLFGRAPLQFTMQFTLTPVISDTLRQLPAAALADTILLIDRLSLDAELKADNKISLVTYKTGRDTINGKAFYTVYYVLKRKGSIWESNSAKDPSFAQVSWMYLYIPEEQDNSYTIGAMYWESMPKDWYTKGYNPHNFDCFRSVLASLSLKK